nr:hypothetical protein [Tanacetum cinerariifolium]
PPRGGAESNQLDELIQVTRDVVLSDSADAWTWELDKSGNSVSSARIHIDEHTLNGTFTSTRWLRCIPIKVNVFIWRLRLDKLSTLVNMDIKGIDVDSLLCPICKAHVENVDHLFFTCEMAHDLWGLLARWCNLDILEVFNNTEWFSWFDDAHVSKSARVILEGMLLLCCGLFGTPVTLRFFRLLNLKRRMFGTPSCIIRSCGFHLEILRVGLDG